MAEHDYVIANQNGANTRSDLNNALAAIVSNNSKATEPTTTYAFMWWADTAADILKQRNAADSAWINILTLSTGAVSNAAIADNAITLAKMAGGTDGELITYDTAGDPTTVPTGSSGEVLTSNGTGNTPTFQTVDGGKVLQVVQTTSTTGTTISDANWTAITGASVTITPSATSSKVLISFNTGGMIIGDAQSITARIKRGATTVWQVGRYAYSNDPTYYAPLPVAIKYLDSPATTAATTYTLEFVKQTTSGSMEFNSTGGTNSLVNIATEIGV